ncbi:hypothetical protein LCGC14_2888250, partial [marine sediment metagenome]
MGNGQSSPPPGVIVDVSRDFQRQFVGSPSLAVLPDGRYVAGHDWFGPGTNNDTTVVFGSSDGGRSWRKTSLITGAFWSSLVT